MVSVELGVGVASATSAAVRSLPRAISPTGTPPPSTGSSTRERAPPMGVPSASSTRSAMSVVARGLPSMTFIDTADPSAAATPMTPSAPPLARAPGIADISSEFWCPLPPT